VVSEADLLLKEEFPHPDQDLPLVWTRRRRRERAKAAASTAGDLMTVAVVSISGEATVAEAARRMHTAGVKRLPVVDERGRLGGIISRADLLKVFSRPDEDLRREILDQVLMGQFALDPSRFLITVRDGVVTLEGRVEQRSLLPWAVRAVQAVEGVVRVENRLTYDTDDLDVARWMPYPWVGR
jgi:CBS domain-containing protein